MGFLCSIAVIGIVLFLVVIISRWSPGAAVRILERSEGLFERERDDDVPVVGNRATNAAQTKQKKRPYMSPYRSKLIAARQQFRCAICAAKFDESLWDIDHRTPLFGGGSDSDDNLQALCKKCHQKKSAFEQTTKK